MLLRAPGSSLLLHLLEQHGREDGPLAASQLETGAQCGAACMTGPLCLLAATLVCCQGWPTGSCWAACITVNGAVHHWCSVFCCCTRTVASLPKPPLTLSHPCSSGATVHAGHPGAGTALTCSCRPPACGAIIVRPSSPRWLPCLAHVCSPSIQLSLMLTDQPRWEGYTGTACGCLQGLCISRQVAGQLQTGSMRVYHSFHCMAVAAARGSGQ